MTDTATELAALRTERQFLHAALGQQVSQRPWPQLGDIVRVAEAWDGEAHHGKESHFLRLNAGEEVRVTYVHEDGWLWGTIVSTGQSGWFGGKGFTAVQQITVLVPCGPPDPDGIVKVPPDPPDLKPHVRIMDFEQDIQEYVDRHGIDEAAQVALKELPLEDQRQVITAELINCRNPSAVLLSRIRGIQRPRIGALGVQAAGGLAAVQPNLFSVPAQFSSFAGLASLVNSQGQAPPLQVRSRSPHRSAGQEEVEEYIQRHHVDEAAAQALRELPPAAQKEVVHSDLNNCRNPSAVLMARIRAAGQSGQCISPSPAAAVLQAGARLLAPSMQPAPILSQPFLPALQTPTISPLLLQSLALGAGDTSVIVEEFIQRHTIDGAAAQALRELPPLAQLSIIETELINCRNPSAVVHSRIQAFRNGGAVTPSPFGLVSLPSSAVEEYIQRFSLDEKVAHELRTLPADAQQYVIETELVNARNPSAVVTSRIQAARSRS